MRWDIPDADLIRSPCRCRFPSVNNCAEMSGNLIQSRRLSHAGGRIENDDRLAARQKSIKDSRSVDQMLHSILWGEHAFINPLHACHSSSEVSNEPPLSQEYFDDLGAGHFAVETDCFLL